MKKASVSTDLFKNKNIPDFIKNHILFKNPTKVQKVFPSIGLPNFKEKANIDKCLVDFKKEGSYVHNLLRTMNDLLVDSRDKIAMQADRLQYLETRAARDEARPKVEALYSLSNVMTTLQSCVDPYQPGVLAGAVQVSEGKFNLKLMKDIADSSGKAIFKKDESLFKIFNKIKDRLATLGVTFQALDQTEQFKIFSKENIPNKEFSLVFSSEGEEGAWDIATMSMRGITSCQRWEGEYPRCLVGSIISKFVGIMYLTSGVLNDGNEKNGNRANLGTKMMRRCVVRYAIDADEQKPCILIDKMYPDLDRDILSLFVNSIKEKTNLPVYYAQELGNKARHIYIPSEKVRDGISDRDWSYQDSPLKSKNDLNVYLLNNTKEEVERNVKGFSVNLSIFLARNMEDVFTGVARADDEIKKFVSNLRMNSSFTPFCTSVVTNFFANFRAPSSKEFVNSQSYYRKYLVEILKQRKNLTTLSRNHLDALLAASTSRVINPEVFSKYISDSIMLFVKTEVAKMIN